MKPSLQIFSCGKRNRTKSCLEERTRAHIDIERSRSGYIDGNEVKGVWFVTERKEKRKKEESPQLEMVPWQLALKLAGNGSMATGIKANLCTFICR